MSKIRLNTELRNKMFNKIKKCVLRMKNTQETRGISYKRERMLILCIVEHLIFARDVVERAYPQDDVKVFKNTLNKSMEVHVM
jgi:hypothetical protein